MKQKTKDFLATIIITLNLNSCDTNNFPSNKNHYTSTQYQIETTLYKKNTPQGEIYTSQKLHFKTNHKGHYLIEGWKKRTGLPDKLEKIIQFEANKTPYKKSIEFSMHTYRIEITRFHQNKFTRERLIFKN